MKRSPLKRTTKPMRKSRIKRTKLGWYESSHIVLDMRHPNPDAPCLLVEEEVIKPEQIYGNPIRRSRMKPVGKKRSKITRDGREILRGKDYQKRRREVWNLAGRRCQGTVIYYGEKLQWWCGRLLRLEDSHIHHVTKRTALGGRDDSIHNLTLLCHECHSRIHEAERRPK